MRKIFLLSMIIIVFLLFSCEISDDDNNYNNDGDVNIYDNFRNLDNTSIQFEDKVYEIQYDVDTVPLDQLDFIVDVNDNDEINGCFQYEIPGFNINVDSVDHFISDDTKIELIVYAKLDNNIIVYQSFLEGLVFEKTVIENMFDEDVDDFIYEIKINYQGKLINTISKTIDVNGMLTERDWSEYNE